MMKCRSEIAVLMTGLVMGCASSGWNRGGSDPKPIDDALLEYVSESEYRSINEARAALPERRDQVDFARRELEVAKADLDIAKQGRDVADALVEQAEDRAEVARDVPERDSDAAADEVLQAHSYRRWVDSKIRQRQARVEAAEANVGAKEAELDLEEAKVELAKANAVADVDLPAADDVDIGAYQLAVRLKEDARADAQAELEVARANVEVRERLVAESADAVPARYRVEVEEYEQREKVVVRDDDADLE
jgi:hypothetical protein